MTFSFTGVVALISQYIFFIYEGNLIIIKVKIIDSSNGTEGVKPAENETIKLTDEERDKLINAVENNKWIPKDVKKRLVKQLSQELVPKKVVDRLRKRMGG